MEASKIIEAVVRVTKNGPNSEKQRNETATVALAAAMLTASSLSAVRTLLNLQESNQPATVRLGAARASLELAIRIREAVEMEERKKLEEATLGVPNLKVI